MHLSYCSFALSHRSVLTSPQCDLASAQNSVTRPACFFTLKNIYTCNNKSMLYTRYTYHIRSNYISVTLMAEMYFKIYTIQYIVGPHMHCSICNIFQFPPLHQHYQFVNDINISNLNKNLISFQNCLSSLISIWNQHGIVYDLCILSVKFPRYSFLRFQSSHLQIKTIILITW